MWKDVWPMRQGVSRHIWDVVKSQGTWTRCGIMDTYAEESEGALLRERTALSRAHVLRLGSNTRQNWACRWILKTSIFGIQTCESWHLTKDYNCHHFTSYRCISWSTTTQVLLTVMCRTPFRLLNVSHESCANESSSSFLILSSTKTFRWIVSSLTVFDATMGSTDLKRNSSFKI